jgi:hypothetical protein
LDGVVKPGTVVIFGELHGTNEIPAFVGEVAVAAARQGKVHVGLELPVDGGLDPQAAFWHGPGQYGVTSRAMSSLIARLREAGIDVYPFDDRSLGIERRDETMAAVIARRRALAPGDIYLVLVGNYHARKATGAPWDAGKRWMASYLDAPLVTLDVSYPEAQPWNCLQTASGQDCGPHRLGGKGDLQTERGIQLHPDPSLGFDGTYFVGPLTASPPAFP